MNIKHIQQSIRVSMKVINKALKQVPGDKKPILMSRINDILTRNIQASAEPEKLKKFQQELEFNLNFIKLSHPNLDYTVDPEEPTEQKNQPSSSTPNSTDNVKSQEKPVQHQFKLVNDQQVQIERLNTKDTFDEQLEVQKKARTQVEFSNWFDGNADPELLKRHKDLLERQHFKGQFWKQRPKPTNFAKAYLQSIIADKEQGGQPLQAPKKEEELQDFTPHGYDKNDNAWQNVKR